MKTLLSAVAVVLLACSVAAASDQIVQAPSLSATGVTYPQPVVTYYGGTYVAPAPVITYYGGTYIAPAPVVGPVPVVTYYGGPVVAPAPVTYYYGPPAVVRTKVYYPYQPVRNFFKAITP